MCDANAEPKNKSNKSSKFDQTFIISGFGDVMVRWRETCPASWQYDIVQSLTALPSGPHWVVHPSCQWHRWYETYRTILKNKSLKNWDVFSLSSGQSNKEGKIFCFAKMSKVQQQRICSSAFFTVTWQNMGWNGKSMWVFAQLVHRSCQGKQSDCRH